MNRFSLVVLSILACSTPAAYSADGSLSMAELCAKAASLQTPVAEARVTTQEIVKRGGSVCECFTDHIFGKREKELRQRVARAGFDSRMFDKKKIHDENPGIVCGPSITSGLCSYIKDLMKTFDTKGMRVVVDENKFLFSEIAGAADGAYVRGRLREIRNEAYFLLGAKALNEALGEDSFYDRIGLGDYVNVGNEERYLFIGPSFFNEAFSKRGQRGALRHEMHHFEESDHSINLGSSPSLNIAAINFVEDRADQLPAACGSVDAARDMVDVGRALVLLGSNDDLHSPAQERLDTAQRIFALRQAEEGFKHAYAECAAAQQS